MFKFFKKQSNSEPCNIEKYDGTVRAAHAQTPDVALTDTDTDAGEIVAAIIAAICEGGQTSGSNLVVRSIVRVPEQRTAWSRLQLDQ